MVSTGKMYVNNKASEAFELIHADDGSFMHDGFDCFVEVKESDYDDNFFYNARDTREFFVPVEEGGEA